MGHFARFCLEEVSLDERSQSDSLLLLRMLLFLTARRILSEIDRSSHVDSSATASGMNLASPRDYFPVIPFEIMLLIDQMHPASFSSAMESP